VVRGLQRHVGGGHLLEDPLRADDRRGLRGGLGLGRAGTVLRYRGGAVVAAVAAAGGKQRDARHGTEDSKSSHTDATRRGDDPFPSSGTKFPTRRVGPCTAGRITKTEVAKSYSLVARCGLLTGSHADRAARRSHLGHYKSNLRDIEFTLFDLLGTGELLGQGRYADVDVDTARSILAEINRMSRDELAASYTDSDRQPPVYDPQQRTVTIPESFKKSFRTLMDSEIWRFGLPEELGGTPLPHALHWAGAELVLGANAAAWMYASGPAFASVIWNNGTDEHKRIAEIMIERRWAATMVLTEPDAGSDVGAGRTRAYPQADGTWHLEGVKRFITSGEHDMAENIIHLVLARPVGVEGAGGPGTKGLSLFVVPKYRFD